MNRQPTVGVLSPLVGGFYFGGVMAGINKAARASGGTIIAVQTFDAGLEHADFHEPPSFARRLAWDRVDGYIILVDAVAPLDLLSLAASDKPLAMVSGTGVADCPSVAPDNAGGIEEAVDHLV